MLMFIPPDLPQFVAQTSARPGHAYHGAGRPPLRGDGLATAEICCLMFPSIAIASNGGLVRWKISLLDSETPYA